MYPSAEGIFLYFKTYSLDKEIYLARTLITLINDKEKESFLTGPIAEVQYIVLSIKIATNAVD